MSSLACKCVFYKPEHMQRGDLTQMNFEVYLENWIPTDRAQRIEEEIESIV